VRTLGILGGLGPESTIDYYRAILALCREHRPHSGSPPILIHSLDVDKVIGMLDAGRFSDLADYLSSGIETLARSQVDFGCIAANTPHIVFDEVQKRSAIPLLSIVTSTANAASRKQLKKVGLFGTGFTMRANFYPDEFQRARIAVIRPTEQEQDQIHTTYISELLKNKFLPESRDKLLEIAQRMMREDGIEALVLAGTELPLLLRGSEIKGLDFLDTTLIHVDAIVDALLEDGGSFSI
jgi:aspartate racemase